jgi:hypothetical protein
MSLQEFLMAGCWLLLKNPTNRQVLGNAFNANPASTKLAHGMMQKLQATVDVADVNEAVSVAPCIHLGVRCCIITTRMHALLSCPATCH